MVISTIILTPVMLAVAYLSVPETFTYADIDGDRHPYHAFLCSLLGCIN